MALSYNYDGTYDYKLNNVYSITLDMSGWDRTTVQIVAPMTGTIYVYGSNNSGAIRGVTQGNASLATDFVAIQAKALATGTSSTSISTAGTYEVDINAQFLRLQGGGANVYKILFNHTKIG